jgi:hypothetical protein
VKKNDKLQADIQIAVAEKFIVPQNHIEFEHGQRTPKYYINHQFICPF